MGPFARRLAVLWLSAAAALPAPAPAAGADPDPAAARAAMVELIATKMRALGDRTGMPALDARVAAAFRAVPRHAFLPPQALEIAYLDTPLPLGHGQNLTMPTIAALMTQALDVRPGDRVLETGTDVGYHAAILATLGAEVHSVEIVGPLLAVARGVLAAQGHGAVQLREADGWNGWAEHGPYDAILLKESAPEIPPPIWRQLKPGGRLVMPLGGPGAQDLVRIVKQPDGSARRRSLLEVRFAPFQGGERT
ncbi:MAG: protein-L-isoaspartate O-methyltransferase [Alphaproteobacteria bacterium]|nr:protein-L-isoaspartate O-methyltransferase [Alphaproteobacteria bacterium]